MVTVKGDETREGFSRRTVATAGFGLNLKRGTSRSRYARGLHYDSP